MRTNLVLGSLVCSLLVACLASTSADPGANGYTPTGDDAGNVPGDAGDAGADAAPKLPFQPANIPPPDFTGTGTLDLAGSCVLDTTDGSISCAVSPSPPYHFATVAQTTPGAPEVAVFAAASIRVEASAQVRVEGSLPAVLVSATTLDVYGGIDASAGYRRGYAGGASGVDGSRGGGAGGGNPDMPNGNGASGGSFCGLGGAGGIVTAPAVAASPPYGTAQLVPLVGGSAGGGCGGTEPGGSGGGAVQLVAGTEITVGQGAVVNVGGGGGTEGYPCGGGSGGAILLEAPTVTMAGILAANGGAGAENNNYGKSQSGQPSTMAAVPNGPNAGAGSAATMINGGSAATTGNSSSVGAGGGGAGRIRIDTATGVATITGTISPDPSTQCVTQGKLAQ